MLDQTMTYDLAVIGAGSAGFSAAITAADLGANVALMGHGTVGGCCVNVGCVPSKTLIRAMETLHQAKNAGRFSGLTGSVKLQDWSALMAQKNALVQDLRKAKYEDLLPNYPAITYLEGQVSFADPNQTTGSAPLTLTIGSQTLRAEKVVIATGSRPTLPNIPGLSDLSYLTSDDALALEQLPASLLVIGGGYIGCELAQLFARAGVQVTLACRHRLLPQAEPEISACLTENLRDEGIEVLEGLTYEKAWAENHRPHLQCGQQAEQRVLSAEKLLITAGRRPNSEALGLEKVGVQVTDRGGIQVNEQLQSSNPLIFAAGDVTSRDLFVYMAAYGAKIAASNALQAKQRRYDATAMPSVVFTDPQVAAVGLTEAQAKAKGYDVMTSLLKLENLPRALAARNTGGLIKLIADKNSDRLLGAHLIAPEGADSIQTATLALKAGMTVTDLAETVFPYLTTVEGLKLAAQTFHQDISKLSCCAG